MTGLLCLSVCLSAGVLPESDGRLRAGAGERVPQSDRPHQHAAALAGGAGALLRRLRGHHVDRAALARALRCRRTVTR